LELHQLIVYVFAQRDMEEEVAIHILLMIVSFLKRNIVLADKGLPGIKNYVMTNILVYIVNVTYFSQ